MIDRLVGLQYLAPLREGGSLPAVVGANGRMLVVKFRGAGQGPKALIAELVEALLGRELGLAVPAAALVEVGDGFGASEPDPEIQDILRGSVGLNFGLDYLPGALPYDPAVDGPDLLGAEQAAAVVWLDAYLTNVDRSPRNPNLLLWQQRVWLIDHGAALFVHHRWEGWRERVDSPFPQIKDHVLLGAAGDLQAANARLTPRITDDLLQRVVGAIPDEWLGGEREFADLEEHRQAYVTYLSARLNGPQRWLQEAIDARQRGPTRLRVRPTHRVV